ncbi:MAG: immunity 51 family protein [Prevotellaceae bacterium]|jgi:hypothetical protein|nr:immunity 51 family protein [Prevotellaceae bacterium]
MNTNIEKKLDLLADDGKWNKIIEMIEQIPEAERSWETIGRYVRALNNNNQAEQAIEVSLQYSEQGANDPLWHYRYGYALWRLSCMDEATAALLRAKELAGNDSELAGWADGLLDFINSAKRAAKSNALRRAAFVSRDPNAPPFEGFDFSDFWDDCEYAREEYIGAPASEKMFAKAEKALGYKLPESYKWLMRQHNGGMPLKTGFLADVPACWLEDCVAITGIMGVDPAKTYSIIGDLGSKFMIKEWGYPDIGVAICDCPSAGHDMIFLDYRACGPEGEPEVVHIGQESDYEITWLADDFESFVRGLVEEEDDDEIEPDREVKKHTDNYSYATTVKHENSISVCFYIEHDKVLAIGEKMSAINEEACMNGYNWEAFFNYYLPKYAPDITDGMDTDPEAGMYVAYYSLSPENEARAEKFVKTITGLVENEEELYRIIREESEEIEWD